MSAPLLTTGARIREMLARRSELALLIIVLATGVITSLVLYRDSMAQLRIETDDAHTVNTRLLRQEINEEEDSLTRLLWGLTQDKVILSLLTERDREGLHKHVRDFFVVLKTEYDISHLYFIDTDGQVIYRAHRREQYGDTITRQTFKNAAATRQIDCGVELGVNFYSLRCVLPVIQGTKLIGYIEAAKELQPLIEQVKYITGDELAFVLTRGALPTDALGQPAFIIDDHQVIYATDEHLIRALAPQLADAENHNADTHFVGGDFGEYALGHSNFEDASRKVSGLFVTAKDITEMAASTKRKLIINVSVILLTVVSAVAMFTLSIRRVFDGLEQQLQDRTREIEFLALHDPLTQLPNRAMFSKMVQHHIQESNRYNRKFSLLFIDLDGFKTVNDTLGHDCGDLLLKEVARRLLSCVRESDVVARLGGDEFVILVLETHDADDQSSNPRAESVAKRVLEQVAEHYTMYGRRGWVTASIGICTFPDHGTDEDELTKRADAAMYIAKESGKNNFQLYSEEVHRQSFERIALEAGLRHALIHDEFELYYQGNLASDGKEVIGVEALLRWNHEELGLVEPGKFISIAEESGLIIPIGKWVLREACHQVMQWHDEGLPMIPVAINLSPIQFRDDHFIKDVKETLETTKIPANYLTFEITERIFAQDIDGVRAVLEPLKALGVNITIDNVGVAYSSLSSLESLPVDMVKIDRSFIKDLAINPSRRAFAEAIIVMGNRLGIPVVAEGVETEEQLEFLRRSNCAQVQGFFFNRPMPANNFRAFLNGERDDSTSLPA